MPGTASPPANVRVSIGGKDLPFTSTAYQPAFASDIYGAEYTVAADVRAGAVVLVLTAPDQSGGADRVASVTITAGGTGYTSAPTVTFQAAPSGGETATGAAVIRGMVSSVTVSTAGTGYTAAPTVVFTGGGGAGAAATAALGTGDSVASVTITTAGSGYTAAPTVAFTGGGGTGAAATATLQSSVTAVTIADRGRGYTTAPTVTFTGGGGSGATATARLTRGGNSPQENLFWARHSLYGKQLIVKIVDEQARTTRPAPRTPPRRSCGVCSALDSLRYGNEIRPRGALPAR